MESHRRWPEERREPSFAVRGRRGRLARTAGLGSLVAITGYLVGGGGDGAAVEVSTSSVDSATVVADTTADTAADTTADTTSSAVTVTSVMAVTEVTESNVAAGPATNCATTYTVVAGDSWYGIADAASVEVSVLYGLNAAGDATMLFPGDSICLPDGTVVTTTTPVVTTDAVEVAVSSASSSASSSAAAAAPAAQAVSSSHGS